MNNSLIAACYSPNKRIEQAIIALKKGNGVIILDDENRENEGDLVFAAETMTVEQMAFTIRYGSGIVCLCLTKNRCSKLELPLMVPKNTNKFKTAFTVSIEATKNVKTGVSAKDRITTIRTAIDKNTKPCDLNRPGHIFPLQASSNGVLKRRGHTEATIDLVTLAGFQSAGVLCELINEDGSMSKSSEIIIFAKKYSIPIITIEDVFQYRFYINDGKELNYT